MTSYDIVGMSGALLKINNTIYNTDTKIFSHHHDQAQPLLHVHTIPV